MLSAGAGPPGDLVGKRRFARGSGSQQGAGAGRCLSFPYLEAPVRSPQLSACKVPGEAQGEDVPRRRLPRAARRRVRLTPAPGRLPHTNRRTRRAYGSDRPARCVSSMPKPCGGQAPRRGPGARARTPLSPLPRGSALPAPAGVRFPVSWCAYFPGSAKGCRGAEGRAPTLCPTQGSSPSHSGWRHLFGPSNPRNLNFLPEDADVPSLDAVARASARGSPQDGPDNRGPGVLVPRSFRTRTVFNWVFIPPGLSVQDSTYPPQYPRRPQASPNQVCPDAQTPISLGRKHPCTPSPSLGIQAFRYPSPQDTGVPTPYSYNIQEFPVPSCQPASLTRRTPRLRYLAKGRAPGSAWGRPGGAEGRPIDPGAGRARWGEGSGVRLSAPTAASQTWRSRDGAGGQGRGLSEPRPPSLRPSPPGPA